MDILHQPTKEILLPRLQQSKRLFLGDNRDPSVTDILGEHLVHRPKYSFRKRNPHAETTLSASWIDHDDTSDYDPREKKTATKRKRPARGEHEGPSRPAKKTAKPSQLVVKMAVKSDTGKALLQAFPTGEEEIGPDCAGLEKWDTTTGHWEMPEILEGETGSRYALRKRDKHGDAGSLGGSPTMQSLLSLDLGHPAARGCKACFEFGHECSLLDRAFLHPCQTCREDRIECELIMAPTRKRTCENCKRGRKQCSYSHGDTDHSLPCKQCQAFGVHCIAGPARYAPGSGEERDNTEVKDGQDSPQGSPLARMAGTNESIESLAFPGQATSGGRAPAAAAEKAPVGVTRTIQTAFAHPMSLAYEPPSDGRDPCHWCSNFAYGIVGLGQRTVEVAGMENGQYLEVDGGHVGDGHPPSRMCVSCAHGRVRIMRCPAHRVVPLPDYNINDFDFDAAYRSLVSAPGREVPEKGNPWCSLCPNPAFFGCGASGAVGCGLLLCERCAVLTRGYKGDLGRVVARNKKEDPDFGCRADVDFVLAGSELEQIAATSRAQLTVTTSPTKRRKVAQPSRPDALPGLFASPATRRHGNHSADSLPLPQDPGPSSTSDSSRSRSSSASPSRYVPAHLKVDALGPSWKARSNTPDSAHSTPEYPSTACAGLSLYSDGAADMTGSEKRDGSVPPTSGVEPRSSSPGVKRTADEASDPHQNVDAGANSADRNLSSDPVTAESADTIGPSNSNKHETNSDNVYPTPSSMAAYTAPTSTRTSSQAESLTESDDPPSIDDQVAKVTVSAAQPLRENQKGYVVSMSWLNKVLARSSVHADKTDKSAAEGDIGPVNNTDLVLDTDPSAVFKDEAGEPFVPLHPDLRMGEDFEIVPEEGWDMIMKWYGLADESPAIVRYAHNLTPGGGGENVMYELNPPIFTVLKLANPSAPTSPQALKEKNASPVKTLASRTASFQKWLRQMKELANIDMSTKVRVWAIQADVQSASITNTPSASRSASPAPAASNAAKIASGLVLDLNTFLSIPDGQRQLLTEIKDQTANPNYNGKMTVGLAGLAGNGEVLVLEEYIGGRNGGDWISEASKQTLNRMGVPAANAKALAKPKAKDPPSTARSAPAAKPTRSKRTNGRALGCTGLRNLGNTCYMNGALQCMRSVEELTHYFLSNSYKPDLNPSNPLAHNGEIAKEYGKLVRMLYDDSKSSVTPNSLRDRVGRIVPAFGGWSQQDSQEFLLFLLDGLQEDLNRILKKPYIEKPDSTDEMVHNKEELHKLANEHWRIYKARNDSVITDLFAGMYKSTIVCPECNKVSITFDPFNNLTLQIPGPDAWSHVCYFFPLHGNPVRVDVEVPGKSTFKAVRERTAMQMGTDPERLVIGEIYNTKLFKMFDDTEPVKDSNISAGDTLGIFELESSPTDYSIANPEELYEPNETPGFDSPKAERMLIPVYQRGWVPKSFNKSKERKIFGPPTFIVVTREEAYDFGSILQKLLVKVDTLTTRDIFNEGDQEEAAHEDSTSDGDDADSADSKIKAASVEGEEGMVDVSVRKESDEKPAGGVGRKSDIPARLRNLFEVKTVNAGRTVPLPYNSIWEVREYQSMSSRVPKASDGEKEENDAGSTGRKTSDESDEEVADNASDSSSDAEPSSTRRSSMKSEPAASPLIFPGEGIVLDWNDESYDALFGARAGNGDSFRGALMWPHVQQIEDPKLERIRKDRKDRKKKGIPLDECLDEFSREEILSESNSWYCPRCKEHRRARKKFELWTAPDILIIHLKRFTASRRYGSKLEDRVNFPVTGLDMSGRVESPEEGKGLVYDLFAVDDHQGGIGGGHYTACAKNFIDNQWYTYNDSSCIGPVPAEKAVSADAYLLFYRRRSDRPLGGESLEQITESSMRSLTASESDSDRDTSPSGDGQRLGGSSLNGSSSALGGVGAAHRAGGGGQAMENENGDESSSGDEGVGNATRQEGMNLDNDYYGAGTDPFQLSNNDSDLWSFHRLADAHQSWQVTPAPPASISEGEQHGDLFEDDGASNRAVDGGETSDADLRLASLTDGPGDSDAAQAPAPTTPMDTSTSIQDIPPPLEADDSEDLDVVELKGGDGEKMHSE